MIHISQRHLKMSKISFSKQSFSGILCKRMMVCDRVCKCLVTLYMSLCDHGQDQQANALLQMCKGVKGKTVGISVQMTLSKRSQLLSTSPNVRPHALQSVLEDNGLEVTALHDIQLFYLLAFQKGCRILESHVCLPPGPACQVIMSSNLNFFLF